MANQAHYGIAPSINLARTLMRTKYDLETTFLHGKLIPLDMIPVIPGSSFKIDLTSFIRMSNPIVPAFLNATVGIHAFFVPWRLLWDHTEEFFGANKTSKGPQKTDYKIPQIKMTNVSYGSVADYLGLPLTAGETSQESAVSEYMANALKLRAYCLIWNEWYRPEQVSNPYLIYTGDTRTGADAVKVGTRNGLTVSSNFDPIEVAKKFDIFTACTISPQYGDPVEISLAGEDVLVELNEVENEGIQGHPTFVDYSGTSLNEDSNADGSELIAIAGTLEDSDFTVGGVARLDNVTNNVSYGAVAHPDNLGYYDPAGSLKVDLNKVTSVSVRDLRFAFALQRYYEALSFGSKYFEILRNIYGVTNPDARLQRPEHIGQIHFPITIQQVLSTAGQENGTTTKLGLPGANSVTLNKSVLSSKGFTEFGYLCIMLSTTHERIYSQGLRREDFITDRFDVYAPQFDHVGDFAVQEKEILLHTGDVSGEHIFGYQEAWYNERYRESRVSGQLNPNLSGGATIAPYSVAETFDVSGSDHMVLDESFMLEDRDNIARILTSGDNGPDYIANFHVELRMVKPMSAHSLPGLIDHVGRL